jgi:hypothetical protein
VRGEEGGGGRHKKSEVKVPRGGGVEGLMAPPPTRGGCVMWKGRRSGGWKWLSRSRRDLVGLRFGLVRPTVHVHLSHGLTWFGPRAAPNYIYIYIYIYIYFLSRFCKNIWTVRIFAKLYICRCCPWPQGHNGVAHGGRSRQ